MVWVFHDCEDDMIDLAPRECLITPDLVTKEAARLIVNTLDAQPKPAKRRLVKSLKWSREVSVSVERPPTYGDFDAYVESHLRPAATAMALQLVGVKRLTIPSLPTVGVFWANRVMSKDAGIAILSTDDPNGFRLTVFVR